MRNGIVLKSRALIQTGFSLIEIVMVMAIISVIMVGTLSYHEKAQEALAEHKNEMGGAKSADGELNPTLHSSKPPIVPLSRNISNQDIF